MAIEQRDNRIIIRNRAGVKEIKFPSPRHAREEMNKINHLRDKNPQGNKDHED